MNRITLHDQVQIWEENGRARFSAPGRSLDEILDYADNWESSNPYHPRRLEVQRWMETADRQIGALKAAAVAMADADKWQADLFKCGQGVLKVLPDLTGIALTSIFTGMLELTDERRERIPGVIAKLEAWQRTGN